MKSSIRILIVEENVTDRALYKKILEQALPDKLFLEEASNSEQGLAIAEQCPIDCVLLDYSLPGRNGIEVLKRLRAKHPFLPVIMITGHGSEALAVSAIKEGAQDYLCKAMITPEILSRSVTVAIKLCKLQHRIEDQHQTLDLFTKALAHDLKEPLRTIRAFSEFIIKGCDSIETRETYLRYIISAAENMDNLVKTVYCYTKLSDNTKLPKAMCDVSKCINSALTNLQHMVKESRATINIDAMPCIYANSAQLVQLFQNLISNALRYANNENLIIHIGVQEGGADYGFFVKDNGPGISEKYWQLIFEPFKRFAGNHLSGSGLGLSICKKIIENHNGKIWCESIPDEGATFYFNIPKKNKNKARTNVKIIENPKGPLSAELANVLLVDDCPENIELTRILLLKSGKMQFNLSIVNNGEEAIYFINNSPDHKIDIILLDINMPNMDGFDFLKHRQENPALQSNEVIMCTTSNYESDIRKAQELGAIGYIPKPPTADKLIMALQKVNQVFAFQHDDTCYLLKNSLAYRSPAK